MEWSFDSLIAASPAPTPAPQEPLDAAYCDPETDFTEFGALEVDAL